MTSPWHTHCPHRVCGTVESAVEVQEVIEQRGIDTVPAHASLEGLSGVVVTDLLERVAGLSQFREPQVSCRGQLDVCPPDADASGNRIACGQGRSLCGCLRRRTTSLNDLLNASPLRRADFTHTPTQCIKVTVSAKVVAFLLESLRRPPVHIRTITCSRSVTTLLRSPSAVAAQGHR